MLLSEPFLALAQQQLSSFEGEAAMARLVLYVAQGSQGADPRLDAVQQWPRSEGQLPPVESDPALRTPAAERRWYPLRQGDLLLGALRAERHANDDWDPRLDRRLQACAAALAQGLSFDLERRRLLDQLEAQREQLQLLVHQLRNPLAALRTYAQLLLRRLDPDSRHRPLVQHLLEEQAQLDHYISSLDRIGQDTPVIADGGHQALLLPPGLPGGTGVTLKDLLLPLTERAAATAALQGRRWLGPEDWPGWSASQRAPEDQVVAEIIANLLENAFRYSPANAPLGLLLGDDWICVWDGGPAIAAAERERIFQQGVRGQRSQDRPGSGLGLALARRLAEERSGSLNLCCSPRQLDPSLPEEGNAFVLRLPQPAPASAEAPAAST
jgi:signal transduction histidine kinase